MKHHMIENHPADSRVKIETTDTCQTLSARCGTGGGNTPMVLMEDEQMEQNEHRYLIRRLTPTECGRLQGFPDWWVDGADGSDSNIYKMWGNGIALPCAADVIGRIVREVEQNESLSLR